MKKKILIVITIVVLAPLAVYLCMRGPGIWRGEPWYGWTAESAWISALKSANVHDRQRAASHLGSDKSVDVNAAIAALADSLANDENEQVRHDAALSLWLIAGRIGPAAKEAVPALRRGLGDSNSHTVSSCARALAEIGPAAKEAAPELLRVYVSAPDQRSGFAEYCLKNLGAHAVPAIGDAMENPGDVRGFGFAPPRERYAHLLSKIAEEIGPAVREAVPACQKALTDKNISVRTYAATTLRFVGKDAELAIPALVLALRRDKELNKEPDSYLRKYYQEVATALAKIGPESPLAINALREAETDQDHPGRTVIQDALRGIEDKGKKEK